MPTNELKPCPFCWGKAKVYDYECERDIYDTNTLGYVDSEYFTRWGCGCVACGAFIAEMRTEAEAIEAWNTRSERTCLNIADNYDGMGFVCSKCSRAVPEDEYDPEVDKYCSGCGAKVVGHAD